MDRLRCKGHQDAKTPTQRTRKPLKRSRDAELIIQADALATSELKECTWDPNPRMTFYPMPNTKLYLRYSTTFICNHELRFLREQIPKAKAKQYYMGRFEWDEECFYTVDWVPFKQACN